MEIGQSFYYHQLSPYVFRLGEMALTWYWLFYIVGFALTLALSLYLVRNRWTPLHRNDVLDLFTFGWVGLLVGGRLGYVLIYNFSLFAENPHLIPQLWIGGMSFHGAVIGLILASYFVSKKKKIPFLLFVDLIATVGPVALLFGRLGNFINGELWGRPSSVPWAVIFPLADQLPRHPSQLYEALTEGLILAIIMWRHKGRLQQPGFQFSQGLIYYGVFRFIAEFFREPDPQLGFLFAGLSMGQVLCLIMIGVGGGILFVWEPWVKKSS